MNRSVLLAGAALVVPLLAVLYVGLWRDPHVVRSPLIGQPAPGFSLRPIDGGEPVALEGLRGRPVVLNFWATWCIPCFQEHGVLTDGARAWAGRAQFLGVVYEDEEDKVREFLRRQGSAYPSLMDEDGKTAIAFGVYGVPETFFIGADGTIVEKHVGALTAPALQANLEKALKAAP
jgi:cytochrome c biogenesis protein CcmG/thiol:disulfide interchange protein DsbE